MAEVPSWQRQNMSKNGGSTGPSSMNSKIAGDTSSFHSKIAKPTVRNYADGGEVKGDQGEFAGIDEAVQANKPVYEDDSQAKSATNDEVRAAAAEGSADAPRMASNDEVRAAMKEGEAKSAPRSVAKTVRSAPRPAPRAATPSSAPDESDAETSRLRSANASASTQARTIQPAKSNGTYRGMDGVVRQKAPEEKSTPMDISGAISRGASAVGSYLSDLVKSPERKPVTYRGLDGKMHKSGE